MLNLNLNILGAGGRSNIGAGPDIQPTTTTTTSTTTTSTTTTSTTTSTTTTAAPISFRTDPYSASLQLAIPGAVFPSLGMTAYNEDVSQLIRGTGTGYGVQGSYTIGRGAVTQSLSNPAPKWVANGYSSSMKSFPQSYIVQGTGAGIGYNNLTSSKFTIETWVNATSWDSIFGATEVYRAYSGGPLLFTLQSIPSSGSNPQIETILIRNDGSEFIYVASPYVLQTGSWYHTAVVRDGNDYNMLINGEVISKFQNSATLKIGETPQLMGTGVDAYYEGVVTASFQDFRVYGGAAKYAIQESGSTYTTPQSMII